ncbi:unnamed protein product [Prunus armeniaca]
MDDGERKLSLNAGRGAMQVDSQCWKRCNAVAPQSKLYNVPFLGSLRFATQPLWLGDPTSPKGKGRALCDFTTKIKV